MKYITLLFSIILTGCVTTATQHKTVLISPPQAFTENCSIEPPPNKEAYTAASMKDRELMLYTTLTKQYKHVDLCNDRLTQLRKWREEQEAHYAETNNNSM